MRRTLWRVVSLVFVVGLALIACDGPNRSQSPSSASGFILEVTISPNVLRGATPGTNEAQGACGAVQVTVVDVHGRFVDGAQVRVTTTLGRFPATSARQEAVGVGGFTTRGVYTDVLCAKAERGTGILTAIAENAVATAIFTVF